MQSRLCRFTLKIKVEIKLQNGLVLQEIVNVSYLFEIKGIHNIAQNLIKLSQLLLLSNDLMFSIKQSTREV